MDDPIIRRATPADVDQLVAMRRDFTFEEDESPRAERPEFDSECRKFLIGAIAGREWDIWVAEVGGQIVSHVYVALIDKVPRPVPEHRRIAYMTNVYTRPTNRGSGIGGTLLREAQDAAEQADVELVIVWPSTESIAFYKRHGFREASSDEPLIWESQPRTT